jgi:plasmid stabilization system protein ParE
VIAYRLLPPAEEEMIEAALFFETANPGLGDDFLDDIQHAIDTAREHPHLGVGVAHGIRRMLVRRFPFSVIYAVEPDQVVWWRCTSTAAAGILEGSHVTANNTLASIRGPSPK